MIDRPRRVGEDQGMSIDGSSSCKRAPGIALFILLAAATTAADTSQPVEWRTIGSSAHTSIDLDGQGSPASHVVAFGDGTFGRASVQGMSEPARVPVEKCPPGTAMEFHMVAGTMVRTFMDELDQVFVRTLSGLACISEEGSVTSENQGEIFGGTGRFEGATGSVVTHTLPQTVSFPEWKGEFNNITNVTTGTIVLKD
jgi:hypothetical protein